MKTYKVASSYIHRKISERDILISIGDNIADFNGFIDMNTSAAFLWDQMSDAKTVDQLKDALMESFSISEEQATNDVSSFIEVLKQHNMVIEQ